MPHLRCWSSPKSASEKSYSKCNILFQLINNCNDLLHFISLVWLFLNLDPTITWNWKLKQWNIRRLLIILTLEPVAYNLRHFLRFIFSFFILSLLICLFLSYGFVIMYGKDWYLMWPGYLRREGFHKKTIELFALQIISLVSTCYEFLLKGIFEHRHMF